MRTLGSFLVHRDRFDVRVDLDVPYTLFVTHNGDAVVEIRRIASVSPSGDFSQRFASASPDLKQHILREAVRCFRNHGVECSG